MKLEYICKLVETTVVDVVDISAGYCRGESVLMLSLRIGDATPCIAISAAQALEMAKAMPSLLASLDAYRSN